MEEYDIVIRKHDKEHIKAKFTALVDVGIWIYNDGEPRIFIPYSNIIQLVEHRKFKLLEDE